MSAPTPPFKLAVEYDGNELMLTTATGTAEPQVIRNATAVTIQAGPKGYRITLNSIPWMVEEVNRTLESYVAQNQEETPAVPDATEVRGGQYL